MTQWTLPTIDSFEEGSHESRNVSDSQKLEKIKTNGFSLTALKKRSQPCQRLDFSPVKPLVRLLTYRTVK